MPNPEPFVLLPLGLALTACATGTVGPVERPATWASPVATESLSNCYRVAPGLYRCAQPSDDGMRELERLGIRSVVNLRQLHSDRDEVDGTGLVSFEVPLGTSDLSYRDLVAALAAVVAAPEPVAVHCWRGSDRTGAVVAAWRVAIDDWAPAAALDEMCRGGYGHSAWFGNLRVLVAGLDPDRLRRDLAAFDSSAGKSHGSRPQ
ncbi:MAG: tyrosine-protein phosphatase [Planctomycetes bacterium]|nr:tyrosine-protein phosphatase [Planctomycetota bacterium]